MKRWKYTLVAGETLRETFMTFAILTIYGWDYND